MVDSSLPSNEDRKQPHAVVLEGRGRGCGPFGDPNPRFPGSSKEERSLAEGSAPPPPVVSPEVHQPRPLKNENSGNSGSRNQARRPHFVPSSPIIPRSFLLPLKSPKGLGRILAKRRQARVEGRKERNSSTRRRKERPVGHPLQWMGKEMKDLLLLAISGGAAVAVDPTSAKEGDVVGR